MTSPLKPSNERDDTILILRRELKARTGRAWSVTGGRGTAWGWITITAPPKRRVGKFGGLMTDEDVQTLTEILGYQLRKVSPQGETIPDSRQHRQNVIDAVRGLPVLTPAQPYWD